MKTVLVFHHMPKCGGTAFREACGKLFPVRYESIPDREDPVAWESFRGNVPVGELGESDVAMITGHYVYDGVRPCERFPALSTDPDTWRLITVMREPLERVLSSYYFRIQRSRRVPADITRWVRNRKNTQAKFLGFREGSAEEFLARYWFVGVTEQLQNSVDVLAGQLGLATVEVDRANVTQLPRQPISEELAEEFRRENGLDYALYHAAARRLNGLVAGLEAKAENGTGGRGN